MPQIQGFKVAGKSWVAFIGSLATLAVPLILQLATVMPPQYQAIIGGFVALATAVGVYHAPYKPVAASNSGPSEPSSTSTPWPAA